MHSRVIFGVSMDKMIGGEDTIHMVKALLKLYTGQKYILFNLCKSCKGQKVVRGTKTVRLDVLPGVDDNDTIKVHRHGGADPEGGQPGDLYVTIKVREHPVFRREKSDIHVDVVLNVTQAILRGHHSSTNAYRGCCS